MEQKNIFSKHVDTVVVLGGILAAALWMTHQINCLDKRLTVIETVLMCNKIMPSHMAIKEE